MCLLCVCADDKHFPQGLCVDAREQGNVARFVRRSCAANSEVREFTVKGDPEGKVRRFFLGRMLYGACHVRRQQPGVIYVHLQ
jgi:hypothetical protein